MFIAASIASVIFQWSNRAIVAIVIVTIVAIYEGIALFLSKNNIIIKKAKAIIQKKKINAIDKKKAEYLSILDNDETE